ncbi:hypothetical protein C5167_049046 [Papaver somniferum]|uniref:non-specific serine/threonine protein kinase n=1 Tax=Papaver somniferum TaxID=3469 RepID=A0A4Y7KL27_PAPSO|nr:hypothetical protein C5167_049046 [Papaver somniferum]
MSVSFRTDSCTDIQTNEEVAIKLENAKAKYPQLLYESILYRWFGVEGDYKVLVMDFLGPSLEDLLNSYGRKFSLKTINRVEFIHSKSYLHRDIKPHNFLMGTGGRANQVYIINFGLAKKYRNSKTQQHAPYREKKDLIGSPRYASRNSHLGIGNSPIAPGKLMSITQMMKSEFADKSLSVIGGVETVWDAAEFILLGANIVQDGVSLNGERNYGAKDECNT